MPSLGNGTYHPDEISLWDKSREVGTHRIYSRVVTATYVDPDVVNFTAQATAWAAYLAGVLGICNGLIYKSRWVNEIIANAEPPDGSINQLSTRETKLLVQYIDNTSQKRLTATVPTLNLAKVTYLPQAGDFVAITEAQGASAEILAFVDAFQDFVVNPSTGNAVTIIGLKVVGRNN